MKSKISLYDGCIENNKQYLLEEWDYEKNELTPKDYAPKRQIKYGGNVIIVVMNGKHI